MNSKKFRNERYRKRTITDLKDLLNTSAKLYADRDAFLVKRCAGAPYEPVSFPRLQREVDALGTALLDLGLTGKKIVIIGENRYEWALTYFAVCCGVGVIVPMERELQAKEIRHLCEWVGVAAIVCTGKLEATVKKAAEGQTDLEYLISIDADTSKTETGFLSLQALIARGEQLLADGRRDFVTATIDRNQMNMLLFTSGTTGLAKGVMLSHENIVQNVMNMSQFVNVEKWVGLSVLPMHHTYEMTCHVFTALYQGCTVAICEGLKHIPQNMAEAQVNVMLGVPLLFEMMHKKLWKQIDKSGKGKKVRMALAVSKSLRLYNTKLAKRMFREIHETFGGRLSLLIAGAAGIDPTVIEDFTAMGIPMIQGYGMTESAPIIAVNMDRYSKPAAVGLPMPNTQIRIEDADENGIGEILCKSKSTMLGYYENPEETARVIVDGWLHTGDYGYFDADGFLYLNGRKKNVIVTKNGKNIFPEEVELYLMRSPYVQECIVFGKTDDDQDTQICAEIFPNLEAIEDEFGQLSPEQVHHLLKKAVAEANDNMPMYKHIRRFHIRETEFDKTASRKIKRYSEGEQHGS